MNNFLNIFTYLAVIIPGVISELNHKVSFSQICNDYLNFISRKQILTPVCLQEWKSKDYQTCEKPIQ